jgi:hypothetical protein
MYKSFKKEQDSQQNGNGNVRQTPKKGRGSGRQQPSQIDELQEFVDGEQAALPGMNTSPSSGKKPKLPRGPTSGPPGLPKMDDRGLEREIDDARDNQAQQNALAKHLLKAQKIFEKNAEDRMTAFIDRHGFTWYHVLMVLMINNAIIVITNTAVSSGVMTASFSPLGELRADSLHAVESGDQNVMVESIHGPSKITVRSAGGGTPGKPMDSSIVLQEGNEGEVDGMTISSTCIDSEGLAGWGEGLVTGCVTAGKERPLRLMPGPSHDLLLDPTGGGMVRAVADVDLGGTLSVAMEFIATDTMHVVNHTVTIGSAARSVAAAAEAVGDDRRSLLSDGHGDHLEFALGPEEGSLVVNGPVYAGGAMDLASDLTVNGDASFPGGANIGGTINLTGTFSVLPCDGCDPYLKFMPDGSIYTVGNLTVEATARFGKEFWVTGEAHINGKTTLGDDMTDTVVGLAAATFLHTVDIGDEPSDTLTVSGDAHFNEAVIAKKDVVMHGDVSMPHATGTLTVAATTSFSGPVDFSGDEVTVGNARASPDAPDNVMTIKSDILLGEAGVSQSVCRGNGPQSTWVDANGKACELALDEVSCEIPTGNCRVVNVLNRAKFEIDAENGNFETDGSLDITGRTSLQHLTVGRQADFETTTNVYGQLNANYGLGKAVSQMCSGLVLTGDTIGDAEACKSIAVLGSNFPNIPRPNCIYNAASGNTPASCTVVPAFSVSGYTELSDDLHVEGVTTLDGLVSAHADGLSFAADNDVHIGTEADDVLLVKSTTLLNEAVTMKKHVTIGLNNPTTPFTVRSNVVICGTASLEASDPLYPGVCAPDTETITMMYNTGDIVTTGTLNVAGITTLQQLNVQLPAAFDGNVVLGNDIVDQLTIKSTTRFNSPVTLGDSVSDQLSVMGATVFYESVQMSEDFAANNNIILGDSYVDALTVNANTQFVNEVQFDGAVTVGDDSDDAIIINSQIVVRKGAVTKLTIDPETGDLDAQGTLDVIGDTTLKADVTLGGVPSDSIDVVGAASFQTSVTLGDDALDAIVVNGHTTFVADVTVGVTAELTVTGNMEIGAVDGSSLLVVQAPMTVERTLDVEGALDLTGTGTFHSAIIVMDENDLPTVTVDEANGNIVSLGSFTVNDVDVQNRVQVTGATTLIGGLVVGDVNTPLPVNSEGLDVAGHSELAGYLTVGETLEVTGDSTFHSAVTIPSGLLTAAGEVRIGTVGGATTLMHSAAEFQSDVDFKEHTTLGDSLGDDIVKINGRFQVMHNNNPILSAFPVLIENVPNLGFPFDNIDTVKGVTAHGQFWVEGDTYLEAVVVNEQATFNGDVNLGEESDQVSVIGTLRVMNDAQIGLQGLPRGSPDITNLEVHSETVLYHGFEVKEDVIIGPAVDGDQHTLTVHSVATFGEGVSVAGDVSLGASPTSILSTKGRFRLHDVDDAISIVLNGVDGSILAVGDLTIEGSTSIGNEAADRTAVTGHFAVSDGVADDTLTVDPSNVLGPAVFIRATAEITERLTVNDNFRIQHDGQTTFDIESTTGKTTIGGDLVVIGEVFTRDAPFRVNTLYADVILGGNNESGVTIEGVQFLDGGFKVARADVINELTEGWGVFIEGVQCKDGSLVLDSHNPGVDPKGETDLLTIINSGYAWDMDGSITTILWKQYFYNTDRVEHHDADAAKMKVGTETDWTEASITHDAYISFETIYHGGLLERIRMASDGDVMFGNRDVNGNFDTSGAPFRFEADNGNTDIEGHVRIGQVPGERYLKVLSTNDDSTIQIKSAAGSEQTARLMLNGDFTEAMLVSAEAQDARLALLDTLADGFAWTRTGTMNHLELDRVQRGQGNSVSISAGGTTVITTSANAFDNIKIGDHILINLGSCEDHIATTCVFGETESREVTDASLSETGQLTVESAFSAEAIVERPYYVSRRVFTVLDDDTMVFGGVTGEKTVSVESSDATAQFNVVATDDRHQSAIEVRSDDDGEIRILAGADEVARVQLEEANGEGFAIWRTGTDNKLQLFRTFKSTSVLVVNAGMNVVQGSFLTLPDDPDSIDPDEPVETAGVIDDVQAGDFIIVEVNGRDEIREVTMVDDMTDPDQLTLTTAFDADTSIPLAPYKVARPVMTINDENDVLFGGTNDDKLFTVQSKNAAVDVVVQAVGPAHEAIVQVVSDDNAGVEVHAGSNKDAKLLLYDAFNMKGYSIARKEQANILAIDNIVASAKALDGSQDTITVLTGTTLVTSTANLFGDLEVGDHIIVQWEDVEYSREVMAIDLTMDPDELTIDRVFSNAEDYTNVPYRVGRRVVEIFSKDDVVIGGNTGSKTLHYGSTQGSTLMSIRATGEAMEGTVTLTGDDAVGVTLSAGADKDARITLNDGTTKEGYRFNRATSDNDLNLQRMFGGPGATISVTQNTDVVNAANGGSHFDDTSGIEIGDLVIVMVNDVEQSRKITFIAADGSSLRVETAFSTDTDVVDSPFEIARQILRVARDDAVTVGGPSSAGDKVFTLESSDKNAIMNVKTNTLQSIAAINVEGDVALLDINSGAGMHTKLKMRDRVNGVGYLISRGGLGNNALSIQQTTTEQTRTITASGGSDLVTALEDGQFASVSPKDRITIILDGVEKTRTVASVNYAATPDEMTLDAAFDAIKTVAHADGAYVVERPILTIADENSIVFGDSTGSKAMKLESTDAAASFEVKANCERDDSDLTVCDPTSDHFEGRISITSDFRSSAVIQSGLDKDAALHLVSTSPRANGFAFTRASGSLNELKIDRTQEGPGARIDCTAGTTLVVGANDGDFDHINIGDEIVVMIDGIEARANVASLDLGAEPDELSIDTALHSTTTLTDHPYMVYRTVMTVVDDHSVLMGGNRGAKHFSVQSADSTAFVTLQSAGSEHEAQMQLISEDYSNLRIEAGNGKDARLYLSDEVGDGFLIRKAKGTDNALTGTTMNPCTPPCFDDAMQSANALTIERTIAMTVGGTVEARGGTAKLIASSDGDFANVRNGDYVTILWEGVEIQRRVVSLTLIADPDLLDVDSPFDADDVAGASYFVTRPLMAYDFVSETRASDSIEYNHLMIGDTMSKNVVDIKSSHGSATLTIEAHDSPVGQADSTGKYGHAEVRVESDSVASVGAYAGTGSEARLVLQDLKSATVPGFMLVRINHNGDNKLYNFRVALGPGTFMNAAKAGTRVTSSNAVNAFDDIYAGDFIQTSVDGIEVIRQVVSVDKSSLAHTLEVDVPFSDVTDVGPPTNQYLLLRPVTAIHDDNTFVFGATSMDKDFTIESTDAAATLNLKAAYAGNRAQFLVDGADTVDTDLKGGIAKDIRLKMRDAANGFVMTRSGADNTLTIDHWTPGPGGTLSAGAGQNRAYSNAAGDFAGITVGDRIVLTVAGNEQTRVVTQVVTGLAGADQLFVDTPWSQTQGASSVPFFVSRRTLAITESVVALAGTGGAKVLTLDSLDDRIDVTFSARGSLKPAIMSLHSDDMAVMQVQGGLNEDAKIKLEDDVSRNGYVFTRGDGANNELQLDRMYPGPGKISCSANSRVVRSNSNLHFQHLDVGDIVAVYVDGVEEMRTILSINSNVNPNTLEVSSMFKDQDISLADYQVAKRVMTVESDDIVVFGGCRGCHNSGDKKLVLSSTDQTAEMTIEGLGSMAKLTMAAAEDAEILVGAGSDSVASLILRDGENNRGWGFSRTDAANNVLRLDRTTDGPGGTITVGSSPSVGVAGSTLVHARVDGNFMTIVAGDQICLFVLSVETCRLISSVDTNVNPDTLLVDSAFSGSQSLENEAYWVKRKVMSYDTDHDMTFGASAGDKTFTVSSTAGSATVALAALGGKKDAAVTLTSDAADAAVTVAAGPDQQARVALSDGAYGYVLGRDTDSVSGDENVLSLTWTQQGPGACLLSWGVGTRHY